MITKLRLRDKENIFERCEIESIYELNPNKETSVLAYKLITLTLDRYDLSIPGKYVVFSDDNFYVTLCTKYKRYLEIWYWKDPNEWDEWDETEIKLY